MNNILLVVDMQNGFARYEQTIKIRDKINDLLKMKIFDKVIATRFLNGNNSIYEKCLNWGKLKTDEEVRLPPSYEEYIDVIFDKYIYDCVNSNFLQKLCQLNNGIYPKKIFIVGADTDCCVLKIATSLFENNIRPIVLTNYCASNGGQKSHEAGILCLKRLIGKKQLLDMLIDKSINLDNL